MPSSSPLITNIENYVRINIKKFHDSRIDKLKKLKLNDVLKRKNPYLFKAKNKEIASEIVQSILDSYISSQEETIFGNWLEGLAVYVNKLVYGGKKSTSPSFDLDFTNGTNRYIVSIKSGPNWANDSQIKKLRADILSIRKSLSTSGSSSAHVVFVNGCCYGKDGKPNKGDYYKYCGQVFWEFISGETDLYKDIIEPLGTDAKLRNADFTFEYNILLNKFTFEFLTNFCKPTFEIDWEKLVDFNSGK